MTAHIDNIALTPECFESSVSHMHLSVEDDTHDEDHKTQQQLGPIWETK